MKSIEELSGEVARQIHADSSKKPTTDSSATELEQASEPIPELVEATVGDPDCPICQGLGYVRLDVPVGHPHFGRLFACPCRLEEIESQRSDNMRSLSNLEALNRFTFETFSPNGSGMSPERQRTLRHAYDVALAYAHRPEGWLLLMGGYGSGKTHLAAAIANEALSRGTTPLFVTVPDLLDHLRAAYAPNSPQPYSDRFEQVRNARLLILDDLGTENATPWALEKLFQLFNYRYMAYLPTVITTNNDLEGMDPRLRSRLSDTDLVERVTILAPDYRQGGVDRVAPNLNTLHFYSDMTLDTFNLRQDELDPPDVKNLASALKLAKTYAADPEGWIIFTGNVGAGKTHLAAAIANERVRLGHPAILVVVPDLLDHLRAAFNPQGHVSYDKRFEEVRRAPLLVLDDLGTESATPWAKEKLFQLINYRYVARLPTLVTTAIPIGELDPKISIRFLDVSRCVVQAINVSAYLGGSGRGRRSGGRNYGGRRRRS